MNLLKLWISLSPPKVNRIDSCGSFTGFICFTYVMVLGSQHFVIMTVSVIKVGWWVDSTLTHCTLDAVHVQFALNTFMFASE